jgi:Flp pilus assembly protein TadD
MNEPHVKPAEAPRQSRSATPDDQARLAELIAEAKARIESADAEGGLDVFQRMAREFPMIPEVYNNLGAVCAALGRRDEAETAFGRAMELQPEAPNAAYNRGLMRFQGGNYLGAHDDFQRAAELAPEDPELQNNLGTALFQLERWTECRRALDRAVSLAPDYLAPHLNLVDVDLAEKRTGDAIRRCRALTESHDDPEVWTKLIDCACAAVEDAIDQATQTCESALARHGGLEAARGQLGRLLRARATVSGEEAAEPSERG